jgi:hypothetical protein
MSTRGVCPTTTPTSRTSCLRHALQSPQDRFEFGVSESPRWLHEHIKTTSYSKSKSWWWCRLRACTLEFLNFKIIMCLPNWIRTLLHTHERLPGKLQDQHLMHTSNIRKHYYANLNYVVRRVLVSPPHRLYINHAVRPLIASRGTTTRHLGASARRADRHAARRRLLHLRRTSGCLGTSRRSSRRSSSTTPPMPRVRVPWHVARLITRLVAPLVVDYFAYAARPGASARHATRHAARHRLLHLRRASGCLGTSRGSSHRSSLTTPPTLRVRVPRHIARLIAPLVVDYSAYTAHLGASARHAAHRRLLRAP